MIPNPAKFWAQFVRLYPFPEEIRSNFVDIAARKLESERKSMVDDADSVVSGLISFGGAVYSLRVEIPPPVDEALAALAEDAARDRAVAEGLQRIVDHCIEAGRPVPQVLRAMATTRPRKPAGRPRKLGRDIAIVRVLETLKDLGLSPTQNDERSDGVPSGAAIVKEALARTWGESIEIAAIQTVWKRRDKVHLRARYMECFRSPDKNTAPFGDVMEAFVNLGALRWQTAEKVRALIVASQHALESRNRGPT